MLTCETACSPGRPPIGLQPLFACFFPRPAWMTQWGFPADRAQVL